MSRSRFGWFLTVLLWAGGIWALSSIPDLNSGLEQDYILRKIAHASEFGVLVFLIYKALGSNKFMGVLLAATTTLAYAGIDELHQSYVLGRVGSLTDVLIDSIGIMITTVLLILKVHSSAKRRGAY